MKKRLLQVNSITYAVKGRELLKRNGFKAYIERTPNNLDRVGCGYSIFVSGDVDAAEALLNNAGIKVLSREVGGDK